MGFKLGPDGVPLEYDTSFNDEKSGQEHTPNANARQPGGKAEPDVNLFDEPPTAPNDEPPTEPNSESPTGPRSAARSPNMNIPQEPPTAPAFNVGGGQSSADRGSHDARSNDHQRASSTPDSQPASEPTTSFDFGVEGQNVDELTCGWFVVVDGPGKGRSIPIGFGQSAVSRSSNERITLNFGDTSITSGQQLIVIYDDEENDFIVAPGNGKNLNRLNGQVIAGQAVLTTGDILKVGKTKVRFVAFCDDNFKWTD